MKHFPILLLVSAIASACANSTPNDVRQSAPKVRASSTKTVDALAQCVVTAWENNKLLGSSLPPVDFKPTSRGASLTIRGGYNNILLLADLTRVNGSTDATLFTEGALTSSIYSDHIRQFSECAHP